MRKWLYKIKTKQIFAHFTLPLISVSPLHFLPQCFSHGPAAKRIAHCSKCQDPTHGLFIIAILPKEILYIVVSATLPAKVTSYWYFCFYLLNFWPNQTYCLP